MNAEQIAGLLRARLHGSDRWSAKCPAHDGRSFTSLSIARGEDGRTLLRCWAGCDVEDICRSIGLRMSDLFWHRNPTQPREKAQPEHVRKALADLWPRITPRERATATPIIIQTIPSKLDEAIAMALGLAVEQELVQIVMLPEGQR